MCFGGVIPKLEPTVLHKLSRYFIAELYYNDLKIFLKFLMCYSVSVYVRMNVGVCCMCAAQVPEEKWIEHRISWSGTFQQLRAAAWCRCVERNLYSLKEQCTFRYWTIFLAQTSILKQILNYFLCKPNLIIAIWKI